MAQGFNFPAGTASINWFDSNGDLHVRVYTTDGENVTERCIDQGGNWYTGTFAQAGEQVSATCWMAGGQVNIRVYCVANETVTEWCNTPNSGWQQGDYTPS